jgi:hypothetical protein
MVIGDHEVRSRNHLRGELGRTLAGSLTRDELMRLARGEETKGKTYLAFVNAGFAYAALDVAKLVGAMEILGSVREGRRGKIVVGLDVFLATLDGDGGWHSQVQLRGLNTSGRANR